MHDLKNRALSFVVSIALITALLILSKNLVFSIIFVVALLGVINVALWEFYKMAEMKGAKPMYVLGLAGSTAYVASVFSALFGCCCAPISNFILGSLLFLFFIQNMIRIREPLASISISYFGILYIVVSLTFLMKINFLYPQEAPISGQWWLMYLIVVTKSADLGAYFIGKSLGKTALAPKISPKKTVEGLFGGLAAALIASICLIFLTPHVYEQMNRPWLFSVIMALILAIVGLLGDLAESLIKRDVGVKDSNKLKGSGGILDMVDSMIFTTPLFYILLDRGVML